LLRYWGEDELCPKTKNVLTLEGLHLLAEERAKERGSTSKKRLDNGIKHQPPSSKKSRKLKNAAQLSAESSSSDSEGLLSCNGRLDFSGISDDEKVQEMATPSKAERQRAKTEEVSETKKLKKRRTEDGVRKDEGRSEKLKKQKAKGNSGIKVKSVDESGLTDLEATPSSDTGKRVKKKPDDSLGVRSTDEDAPSSDTDNRVKMQPRKGKEKDSSVMDEDVPADLEATPSLDAGNKAKKKRGKEGSIPVEMLELQSVGENDSAEIVPSLAPLSKGNTQGVGVRKKVVHRKLPAWIEHFHAVENDIKGFSQ
jgi:hypothetical protein